MTQLSCIFEAGHYTERDGTTKGDYNYTKNPTKHPVDLPPLTLGQLKNFLISIFEFIDFHEAETSVLKVSSPSGSRPSNPEVFSLSKVNKLKNLDRKFFRAARKVVADQQNTIYDIFRTTKNMTDG